MGHVRLDTSYFSVTPFLFHTVPHAAVLSCMMVTSRPPALLISPTIVSFTAWKLTIVGNKGEARLPSVSR